MNDAIYWLNVNLVLTAVMWLPYVLNRLVKQGIPAMGYRDDLPAVSDWAVRAKKAHSNSVENLVIFAPAVLSFMMLEGATFEAIQCSIGIYFFSRIIYYVCYTFKVPYVRTLSFAAGWGSTIYILCQVCQLAG
jgi:uncharacterized MAPEG superfamily protein